MKKRILIIDDDTNLLELISSMLENYDVKLISDPAFVVSIIEEEHFDLAIVDIKMPKIDGFTLIKKIHGCDYGIPIIVMSGYTDSNNIIESLRLGAVDFLSKPFTFENINKSVQRVLFSNEITKTRKGEDDLVSFIKQQKKEYIIPNRLKYIDSIIKQLTWFLEPMGVINRKELKGLKITLSEMLMNAYEHGNLEVTNEEKGEIFKRGDNFLNYLKEKENNDKYKNRCIFVSVEIVKNDLIYEIEDQGNGFKHNKFDDHKDLETMIKGYGHGLLIAGVYVDEISYNEKGNKVKIVKKINK